MSATVPSFWAMERVFESSGLPSIPSIRSWCRFPNSGGRVVNRLSKSSNSRSDVSKPREGVRVVN